MHKVLDLRVSVLQACDIVFIRDWTPISWLIRLEEGDFDYSHVCIGGEDGFYIYSTGAKNLLWFGRIDDVETYFRDKKICIKRYKGLTDEQKIQILEWCKQQIGKNRYPIFKLLSLMFKGLSGRTIHGTKEDPKTVRNTYCAESIALAFTAAGIVLNADDEIQPDAQTPETIAKDPNLERVYEDK